MRSIIVNVMPEETRIAVTENGRPVQAAILGKGRCHILSIRPEGGAVL